MTFTYDTATDVGKVRALIPDKVDEGHLFEDEDIEVYLGETDNNVYLAAAMACEVVAFDNMLLFRANVRADDGSVTASQTSELMLKRAKDLRDQAGDIQIGFRLSGGETTWPSRLITGL